MAPTTRAGMRKLRSRGRATPDAKARFDYDAFAATQTPLDVAVNNGKKKKRRGAKRKSSSSSQESLGSRKNPRKKAPAKQKEAPVEEPEPECSPPVAEQEEVALAPPPAFVFDSGAAEGSMTERLVALIGAAVNHERKVLAHTVHEQQPNARRRRKKGDPVPPWMLASDEVCQLLLTSGREAVAKHGDEATSSTTSVPRPNPANAKLRNKEGHLQRLLTKLEEEDKAWTDAQQAWSAPAPAAATSPLPDAAAPEAAPAAETDSHLDVEQKVAARLTAAARTMLVQMDNVNRALVATEKQTRALTATQQQLATKVHDANRTKYAPKTAKGQAKKTPRKMIRGFLSAVAVGN